MKTSVLAALALTLVSATSAFADGASPVNFEMETIVSCKSVRPMLRVGENLEIRHARIGSYSDAVFSQFVMGRTNNATITNVIHTATGSDDIFTARVRNGEFKLTIDQSRQDAQGWAPATFELGELKYDLLCRH